jgi:hypothetical protein
MIQRIDDSTGQRYPYDSHSVNDTVTITGDGFFGRDGVYNRSMARGWESKSIEEQQSAVSTQVESKQRLTPQQAAQKQEREAIELSRRRVLEQLESVQNPRHRQMLEIALSELDARLARLG